MTVDVAILACLSCWAARMSRSVDTEIWTKRLYCKDVCISYDSSPARTQCEHAKTPTTIFNRRANNYGNLETGRISYPDEESEIFQVLSLAIGVEAKGDRTCSSTLKD